TNMHIGDVADIDRRAPGPADHNVFNIRHRVDKAQSPDYRPLPVLLENIAADVQVAAPDSIDHHRERNVESAQPVGIDVDLILLHVSAGRRNLGHSGNRRKLIAYEPVLQRPQLAQGLALALYRVPEDLSHS